MLLAAGGMIGGHVHDTPVFAEQIAHLNAMEWVGFSLGFGAFVWVQFFYAVFLPLFSHRVCFSFFWCYY